MEINRILSIILAMILLLCCSGVQGTASNLLRIQGSSGWTEHIVISQGATAYLVVLAANEGIGYLNELSPDGTVQNYNYFFRSYDRLPFYADKPGRHVFSYAIDGIKSNPVEIDVVGTYAPTAYQTPYYDATPAGVYAPTDGTANYPMPISQRQGGF